MISVAILFDALQLAEPVLDWKGGGKTFKKYKMLLSWLLKHPNTVDLFSIMTLFLSVSVIAWRLHHALLGRVLLGEDEE